MQLISPDGPFPDVRDRFFFDLTKGEYLNGNSYYTRAFFPKRYTTDEGEKRCRLVYYHPLKLLMYSGSTPELSGYDGPYQSYMGRWAGDEIAVTVFGSPETNQLVKTNREISPTFLP